MNEKILLLLLFLTTLTCSSKTEKPIPEKRLEGWAGNPDNPNEKPFDYFYMSHAARASQKAMSVKSGKMMEATCTEAVRLQGRSFLVRKMISEAFFSGYPTIDQVYAPFPSNNLPSFNYFPAREFYFQTLSNAFNTLNLIAMTNGTWRSILETEYYEKIKDAKVKDCKPLAIPGQEVPLSEWKECECIIYSHIPGGKDGIIARAKELDKN